MLSHYVIIAIDKKNIEEGQLIYTWLFREGF